MHFVSKIRDKAIYLFRNRYEKYYFNSCRKKNKNTDFSLFSPNCFAGIIYHRLGLEFKSPTINMLFPIKKQYLKFVSNLKYYMEFPLVFIEDKHYNCPVGMVGDVKIVFNHDTNTDTILSNWERRKKRINYNNIYLMFDDLADAEYTDLFLFSKIDCKGKVIITAKEYPGLDNVITISKYEKRGEMQAYLLDKNSWTGKNAADNDFDFVKWLNS